MVPGVVASLVGGLIGGTSRIRYYAVTTHLFVYALGRDVPVVLAGKITGALKQFRALGRWSAVIEKAGAVIILGVGL